MLFPILAVVFGALAIYAGWHTRADISARSGWPVVRGRLVKRDVRPARHGTSEMGAKGPTFVADIDYVYSVNGAELRNTQLYSTPGQGGDADTVRKEVAALPAEPEVHYNPQNPAESYLLLTSVAWVWFSIGFGVLLVLLGGLIALGRAGNPAP